MYGVFLRQQICRRCGERYELCDHIGSGSATLIPDDHIARIKARYAIGKRFDTEGHDAADYFTDPPEAVGPSTLL